MELVAQWRSGKAFSNVVLKSVPVLPQLMAAGSARFDALSLREKVGKGEKWEKGTGVFSVYLEPLKMPVPFFSARP